MAIFKWRRLRPLWFVLGRTEEESCNNLLKWVDEVLREEDLEHSFVYTAKKRRLYGFYNQMTEFQQMQFKTKLECLSEVWVSEMNKQKLSCGSLIESRFDAFGCEGITIMEVTAYPFCGLM